MSVLPEFPNIPADKVQPTDFIQLNGTRFVYNTYVSAPNLAAYVQLVTGTVDPAPAGELAFYPGPGTAAEVGGTPTGSGVLSALSNAVNTTGGVATLPIAFPPTVAQIATIGTIALLRAATSATLTLGVVFVEGYYANADMGGGLFELSSTDTTSADNGATIIVDASSRRWYRFLFGPLSIKQAGAKGDGTTDDTTAIQAAITLGGPLYAPAGSYVISGQLTLNTFGQILQGAGKLKTFFLINALGSGFTTGIFYVVPPGGPASGDACVGFRDFCVSCHQPSTTSRASLIQYPPMFYLDQAPRVEMTDVRIVGGLDGIHMNVNCGGFRGTRLDLATFSHNVYMDGNADITTFTDCEIWPFSATGILDGNLIQIFADSNCVGVFSLRNDYFLWENGLILCGRSALFGQSSAGFTYGGFTNTGFDTFGGPEVSAGYILLDNCFISVAGALGTITKSKNAIVHTGGYLSVRGCYFVIGAALPPPSLALVLSTVPSGAAGLEVVDCVFETGTTDWKNISIAAVTNASLTVNIRGNTFQRLGNTVYTTAIVDINGGSGSVIGNALSVAGTTTAPWLVFAGSTFNQWEVSANSNNGWGYSFAGQLVTAASILIIPPIFGEQGMSQVVLNGGGTVNGMSINGGPGVASPYAGTIKTIICTSSTAFVSGTVGNPAAFVLNGRTNFNAVANSSLTVQLSTQGNWQEIGRCA